MSHDGHTIDVGPVKVGRPICPACIKPVNPCDESYARTGWHDACAQTDVWANTPSGRRALAKESADYDG